MLAILNSAILHSTILNKLIQLNLMITHSFSHFEQKKLHSFILTQLDDGSHLEFYLPLPSWIQPFYLSHKKLHSFILSSSSLELLQPSWIWIQPFCTKKLHSFILTQLDDWQPSSILPCWIQTLPSWIETPCYLLSDSLKNTLTPLWLWLKLIQSD